MNNRIAPTERTNASDPFALITTLADTVGTISGERTADPATAVLAICCHGIHQRASSSLPVDMYWALLHSGFDNTMGPTITTDANWNSYVLPFAWPQRNSNRNYQRLTAAIRALTNVTQVHLYGCAMASNFIVDPIRAFTTDVGKEVWAYYDLLLVANSGDWLRIVEDPDSAVGRRASTSPRPGVRYDGSGYVETPLETHHGPMPGWQVRGRPSGSSAIVDVLEPDTGFGAEIRHFHPGGRETTTAVSSGGAFTP
jgi:hypothetical protein